MDIKDQEVLENRLEEEIQAIIESMRERFTN